jgi:hypothetical protein
LILSAQYISAEFGGFFAEFCRLSACAELSKALFIHIFQKISKKHKNLSFTLFSKAIKGTYTPLFFPLETKGKAARLETNGD